MLLSTLTPRIVRTILPSYLYPPGTPLRRADSRHCLPRCFPRTSAAAEGRRIPAGFPTCAWAVEGVGTCRGAVGGRGDGHEPVHYARRSACRKACTNRPTTRIGQHAEGRPGTGPPRGPVRSPGCVRESVHHDTRSAGLGVVGNASRAGLLDGVLRPVVEVGAGAFRAFGVTGV